MKKIIILLLIFSLFPATYGYTDIELRSANILGEQGIIVNQVSQPEKYKLDDTITRREFMKVVINRVGKQISDSCEQKFADMKRGDWGCKYIEWGLKNDFVANNRNFRPDDPITKAESMKLILKARSLTRQEFNDDWRYNDMQTAYFIGIISTSYLDYNTYARRGWIFEAVATKVGTYGGGGSSGGDGLSDSSGNSSSSSGEGSSNTSLPGNSSSSSSSSSGSGGGGSGNSSSSGGDTSDTNGLCSDNDWRNCVP